MGPTKYFVDMYDPGYKGEEVIYPRYGSTDILTEDEIKHCRALYAGEVSLVDRWFGHFLRRIEDTGLLKNTCIIFTADHGFYLGEHNLIGKSILKENYYTYVPLYEELVRIPLIIYIPGIKHRRIKAYVQPPDITGTIFNISEVKIPSDIHGRSLLPLIWGKEKNIRDFVVSAPSIIHGSPAGEKITITDKSGWCLIYESEKGEKYSIKAVDSIERETVKGSKKENELYFLPEDPYQKKNLIKENKKIFKDLKEKLIKFLYEVKTDEKIIEMWK